MHSHERKRKREVKRKEETWIDEKKIKYIDEWIHVLKKRKQMNRHI